jgi:EAL domain-containing protein (putative c-di-GMP-specific phosphodiesterase class I)
MRAGETDADPGAHACFDLPISMAFQPIVDVAARTVFAHEALVRGRDGAGAGAVLAHVTVHNRVDFDQACRVRAIELAAELELARHGALVSINFLPNAVDDPAASVALTVEAAEASGFPLDRIIFEFTEGEPIEPGHLQSILKTYRGMGLRTAIDDFGAGYSGLTLLSRFQPDVVKLDMALVRCIDVDRVKRTMVRHIMAMAHDLGVQVVAEGIETLEECETLCDLGVTLLQGYLFAKPAFEALAEPAWPKTLLRPCDPMIWAA